MEDLLFSPRHCRPLVLPHHPLRATLLNARGKMERGKRRGTGRRTERGVYLNAIPIAWLETHTANGPVKVSSVLDGSYDALGTREFHLLLASSRPYVPKGNFPLHNRTFPLFRRYFTSSKQRDTISREQRSLSFFSLSGE